MSTITRLLKTLAFLLATYAAVLAAETSDFQEDQAAIGHLVSEYASRWDRKDAEAFSKLFADDGAIDWVFGSERQATIIEGRAQILVYARKAHSERLAGKQSKHHFSDLEFESLDEDHAVTEHMASVTHQLPGQEPKTVTTGRYRIVWKKAEDQWLIDHRTLYLDR